VLPEHDGLLAVYMQQIFEQYGRPTFGSREPTQAMKTTARGCRPSEGRTTSPFVGPEAFISRSSWRAVITSGYRP